MNKKIRLILLVIAIFIIGSVTVWHSFYINDRNEKEKGLQPADGSETRCFMTDEENSYLEQDEGLTKTDGTAGNTVGNTIDNTIEDVTEELPEEVLGEALDQLPEEVIDCQHMVASIRCDSGGGNAVLLCEKEDFYLFCTAAHVVSGLGNAFELEDSLDKELWIELGGQQVCAKNLWVSNTYDVAFLEIDKDLKKNLASEAETDDCQSGNMGKVLEGVKATGFSEDGYINLRAGDMLIVWSYYSGELLNLQIQVNNPWILVEDFGYHMIWASTVNAKGGMSGSGVFDCEGHLAGILCGGNETEVAVLPVNIIMGELKNSGLDISYN